MKKRILSVFLALVLCLGLIPMVSQAADVTYPVTGGSLTFDLTTGTITGCGEGVTEANIPAQIYDVPVTAIGAEAFLNCGKLTGVTIPGSVTAIGAKAFYGAGLTAVTIPDSVTEIGEEAFRDCENLLSASVPGSASSLGERIFEDCSKLTSVTLGEGITDLPAAMFSWCHALRSVTLPQSLVTVGEYAFSRCYALQSIQLPDKVTAIKEAAFDYCDKLEDVQLGNGLQTIGKEAFNRCHSLKAIQLPDSVSKIAWGAFRDSGLTSIRIPSGVTELSEVAFRDCSNLKEVSLPVTVTLIHNNTFWGCYALTDIYYAGSADQWARVDNQSDTTAAVHLNSTGPSPIGNTSPWAASEMEKAAQLDLIPDVLQGEDLTQSISRLEFAAVCVKVFENLAGTKALPAVTNPFTDTKDTEVLKAYNTGITNGLSATTFGPDNLLNREMCATMLTRVFKRASMPGWNLADDGKAQFKLTYTMPAKFADDGKISDWARDSVYFMAANGIINGVGGNKFAPKNTTSAEEAQGYANATREQALAIAVRMVENLPGH